MSIEEKTNKNKKNFRKSFRTKLITSVLIIIGALFLAMIFGSLVFYQKTYRQQEISNQTQQIERISSTLATLQLSIENIAKQVAVSEALQENISVPITPSADYFVSQDSINSALRTYTYIIGDIEEVMVYTKDGITFSSYTNRGQFVPENESWYTDFKATGEQKGYTDVHLGSTKQNGRTNRMISYVLTYYSLLDHRKEMGDLILSIDYDKLEDNTKLDMEMLKGYGVYNERDEKILGDGEVDMSVSEIKKQNLTQWTDKKGNIYLCSKEMRGGWFMVVEISSAQMQKQLWFIGLIIALVFILLAAAISLAIIKIINRVIEPVNRLSEAAGLVGQGNFDVTVEVHTGDEIEVLADGFNQMARNVRDYMQASIEQEKIRRRSQVDQLLLQINPHFIYNTLNSIVYMARMEGNQDIEKFVNAFILLLQSTLHVKGGVYITLEEELKNVENYLVLQKYRYLNKFQEELDCPEELLNCQVPKVILQPLVENAIFHGIAPMEGKGILKIKVTQLEDNLNIVLEDNGIGMTQDAVESLLTNGEKNMGGMRKIGVSNVLNRIKEICGIEYGFVIESRVSHGTKITIVLPVKRDGDT
ncbi:MAG: histidine kinase [Hespellia sp.]|nr:histidine kinase [Hespellia sp.]